MGLIGELRVRRNRLAFRRFEAAVAGECDLARQLEITEAAAAFARQSGCGSFSSSTIERAFLCRAAGLAPVPVHDAVLGAVLMVMSEAYAWGGHTRAVERWIEADGKRRYSVAVTRQKKDMPLPERLRAAVDRSGGEVMLLDGGTDAEVRAAKLREFSSRFEFVVLHVHPDDPLPIMAYGTEAFPRPVGLYDHLDYGFWLGVSVTDGVGELREWGRQLSLARRGVAFASVLGIPGDSTTRAPSDRLANRLKLGLPADARIVVTAGAAYKYQTMPGRDFLDIALPVLKSSEKAYVIGIGMTFDDFPKWKRIGDLFGGRFRALGRLPHEEMMAYLTAADVAVDSWPVPGFTSLADAVACGCPVLTCPTPGGLMDWMVGSAAECASPGELIRKALTILSDRTAGKANLADVVPRLEASRSPEAFVGKVDAFFSDLATQGHRVRDFAPVLEGNAAFDDFLAHLQAFDLNWMAERWFKGLLGKWHWLTLSFAGERHPLRFPALLVGWALHGFRGTGLLRDWLPYCLVERRLRRQEGTEAYFRWTGTGRIKYALKYWLPHRFVLSHLIARCGRKAQTEGSVSPSVPRSGFSGSIGETVRQVASRRNDSRTHDRKARILVCLHLFYPDLWPVVRTYLENLAPYRWDLFVTYPEGLIPPSTLDEVKAFKADVRLLSCRNAGYDIGPFVETLRQIDLNAYDIVFKLQTKGCHRARLFMYDQVFKGADWLFNLYDGILDGGTVHEVISTLMGGECLLAAAENLIVKDPRHKRQLVKVFCEARSLPYDDDYRFVAGTCFAARAETLAPLKALGLTLDDFADTVRGDFSLAHALERWMCFAAAGRIKGVPVSHGDYPEEADALRKTSSLRLLEDDRFKLDPDFMYRVLELKPVVSYEVVEIPLGDIRRIWVDGRPQLLSDCAPFRYLDGDVSGYDRYCTENAERFGFEMSRTRFDALRQSMEAFDARRMPVVYGNCNVILDGQHRSCILLRRFGPAYRIKVVRIH